MPKICNEYFINSLSRADSLQVGLFKTEEYAQVRSFFHSQSFFQPTSLNHLRGLAKKIGVGDILLKDESTRFGLDSFKILGVAYALHRLLSEGRLSNDSVLACATEGNHGRAVAHIARKNNLKAKIYVAADTVRARIEAIEKEGAEVCVIAGSYDEAVREVAKDAEIYDWKIISDTSWEDYDEIPRLIMAGYTWMLDEAKTQWEAEPPDIVLVQAGVGSLAAAIVSWFCRQYAENRPRLVVCEPSSSASLLKSASARQIISIKHPFDTVMVGLRCGETSPLAWSVLSESVDAFIAVSDDRCSEAMRLLAYPDGDDPVVIAGAAGACGMAGLLAISRDENFIELREAIGMNECSRVLLINTEGATDPESYARITGCLRKEM